MTARRVLVSGATGYIGGRLVPRLLESGYSVRVLVRSPQKLTDVPWADQVEIARGDLGGLGSVQIACIGMDVLYYVVHSMGAHGAFERTERIAAENVASAVAEPAADGGSVYRQRAIFFPRGLGGRLYWFAILPFHGIIFSGMANRITEAATMEAATTKVGGH